MKLKPCPLCGCDQVDRDSKGNLFWIRCVACGVRTTSYGHPMNAEGAWNSLTSVGDRPSPAERRAAWVSFVSAHVSRGGSTPTALEVADALLKDYDARFGGEKGKL